MDEYRIDRLCLQYMDAAHAGDLETMAKLWALAEHDDALAAALGELCDGMAAEDAKDDPSKNE